MLAILAFIAYAIQYAQNVSMSVAIVCMVKNVNETCFKNQTISHNVSALCEKQNETKKENQVDSKGEFEWNKQLQGFILSTYFVGYLITEIPGGWLSLKFGSKIVLAVALLIASLMTILLPFAARINVVLLIVCRFIIGLAHGVVWPAFSGFWVSVLS